jgi:hypothetical protein
MPRSSSDLLQQLAGHVVELALHQPGHQVHHGDLHAALHQAVGRFQAQQAAADDHRVLVLRGRVDHGLRVGDVAVGQHALQVLARHRQDERVGAGGHEQAVVRRTACRRRPCTTRLTRSTSVTLHPRAA